MHGRSFKASLIIGIAALAIAGCGSEPNGAPRRVPGPTFLSDGGPKRSPQHSNIPQANPNEQDITKNPFVIWIKQTHPKTAAAIINQYLSNEPMASGDPAAEGQRILLRRQVLDTVTMELIKNLGKGLPKGLTCKLAEPGHVRVSGYQKYFGFKIDLQFDFTIQMDSAGMVWIRTPYDLVKADAESTIVKVLGGNLNDKAFRELIKNLDKEGPKNAKMTPGMTYTKGGAIKIDPGFAFINMPS